LNLTQEELLKNGKTGSLVEVLMMMIEKEKEMREL
jgi:hypothetical protein